MAKKNDLTPYATSGYEAAEGSKQPYIDSSACGMAWSVGAWLKKTGRCAPRDVSMSRGYTMRANDMLLNVENAKNIIRIS